MRRPHKTYFLKNKAKEIYKRKQEITEKEIKKQLELFSSLARKRKEFKIINTNRSVRKISKEISAEILSLFRKN
jgi:hypothetical protein